MSSIALPLATPSLEFSTGVFDGVRHDVVFIDAGVERPEQLRQGLVQGIETYELTPQKDAIAQITAVLQGRTDIANIHIVSHGAPGCLFLGKGELSLSNVEQYSPQLKTWFGTGLGSGQALLLYGCNVAVGDAGAEFLEKLHRLTGVEIFASATRIGSAHRGGHWVLEKSRGQQGKTAAIAFTPQLQATYQGVFTIPVNFTADLTEGTEADTTNITLTVTADAAVTGAQTVRLNLDGISSTATGSDFDGLVAQITIPDGETQGSLSITVKDDAIVEGLETAEFFISSPSAGIVLGTTTSAIINVIDDEQSQVNLSLDTSAVTVSEAGTTAITLTVEATQAVQGEQTVDFSLTGDAAIADFLAESGFPTTLTIPNGQRKGEVSFSVADDALIEALETATFTISNPSSGIVLGPVTEQSLEIIDNDVAGFSVTESGGSTAVSEPNTTDSFEVVLTAEPLSDVVLTVGNSNPQTATADQTQLTFNPGNWDTPQTVTVTAVDDDRIDGPQTSTVSLAIDQANSADQFDAVAPQTLIVSSADDDSAGITLSDDSGLTTTEAGGSDSFGVRLTSQPTSNVTLSFASNDLGEGNVTPSVVFTPTDWNVVQTVTVTGQDDALADGNVGYSITTTVSSGDGNYDGLAVGAIAVTNTDNDTAGFTIANAPVTVAEPGTNSSFSVVLDAQPTTNVVLQLSSSDSSEASVPATVTFTPTDWNQPQIIAVNAVDDGIVDGAQTSQITVSVDDGNSDDAFDAIADQTVNVTTNDDDVAGFSITPGITTVSETGSTGSFAVVLDTEPSSNVVLDVSSDDLGEATVAPTALTFTPSDWDQPQSVAVTGVDDAVVDGVQSSQITVAVDAANSDDVFDGLPAQTLAVTTTDDEVAGFTLTPANGSLAVTEAGTTDTFSVVLNAEPTGNVALTVNSGDATEASVDLTTLTFTPSDWDQAQTVTVTGQDDSVVDGDQTSQITVSIDAANTVDGYDNVNGQSLTVTTTDDEVAAFTVTQTDGNTTIDEAGSLTDSFSVVLDAQPESPVVFTVTSAATDEATVSEQSLTFTSANWDQAQVVTVTGVSDSSIDGPQTSTVTVAVNDGASADAFDELANETFDVTVQDSDIPGFSVIQTDNVTRVNESGAGNTDSLTVQLNVQPQSDVVIAIANSNPNAATLSVSELTFTAADWDQAQTVTLTGVDNSVIDGDRTSTLTLSIADDRSDDAFDSVENQTVDVTTQNDDEAGFTITETVGATTVSETGTTDTFEVVLTAEPSSDVVLTVVSAETNEATVDQSALTFTASDWDQPQTVTVSGVDDVAIDGNQSTNVTLAIDSGASDSAFSAVASQSVTVTTIDDDEPGITVTPTTELTTTEAGGTASLEVVLNKQPSASVTVSFSSDTPSEATAPEAITFTTENWDTAQTVVVTGVDDSADDGDVGYAITLTLASEDAGYAALTPDAIALTNIDDDENSAPNLVSEIADQQAQEGELFEFSIPSGTFVDPDVGDVLTYQALEQRGDVFFSLPSWLTFSAENQRFSGTPTGADVGNFEVLVTARDDQQLSATDRFQLSVAQKPTEPTPEPTPVPGPELPPSLPPTPSEPTSPNSTPPTLPTEPVPPTAAQPFSLTLTQGNTDSVNELIVIRTDDAEGRVNGIAPGEAGYTEALLQNATVVFSTLKAGRLPGLTTSRTVDLESDSTVQFAVIENGSLDSLRQGGAGTLQLARLATTGSPVIAAETLLNSAVPLSLQVPLQGGSVLSDVVLQAGPGTAAPLGSGLQGNGNAESELLDFRNETGTKTASFEVYRDANYDNLVGFYFIDNELGQVSDSLGNVLNPGDAGYIDAALANRLTNVNLTGTNGSVETFTTDIEMGQLLAAFIVVDGTVDQLLDGSSGNDPSIYFTHMGANGDGTDHIRLIGDNTFGFEDLVGGGDMDFDDIVVKAAFA